VTASSVPVSGDGDVTGDRAKAAGIDEDAILVFLSTLYGAGHGWPVKGQTHQQQTEANIALVREFVAAARADAEARYSQLAAEVRAAVEELETAAQAEGAATDIHYALTLATARLRGLVPTNSEEERS
jgi:hypothetical protein